MAAAVIGLMAVTSVPAEAKTTSTQTYVSGPGGDLLWSDFCAGASLNPSDENLGVVCFPRRAGSRAKISITDASGRPVPVLIAFRDSQGWIEPHTTICGTSATVAVPRRWIQMEVYLAGPIFGPSTCLLLGGPEQTNLATTGTVRATFWTPRRR